MKKVKTEERFTLCLVYDDGSEMNAEVIPDGPVSTKLATLSMICRGTLMASSAKRSYIYNSEGFEMFSYMK